MLSIKFIYTLPQTKDHVRSSHNNIIMCMVKHFIDKISMILCFSDLEKLVNIHMYAHNMTMTTTKLFPVNKVLPSVLTMYCPLKHFVALSIPTSF